MLIELGYVCTWFYPLSMFMISLPIEKHLGVCCIWLPLKPIDKYLQTKINLIEITYVWGLVQLIYVLSFHLFFARCCTKLALFFMGCFWPDLNCNWHCRTPTFYSLEAWKRLCVCMIWIVLMQLQESLTNHLVLSELLLGFIVTKLY